MVQDIEDDSIQAKRYCAPSKEEEMDNVSYTPTVPKLYLIWHVGIEIPDWGFNVLKCARETERERENK